MSDFDLLLRTAQEDVGISKGRVSAIGRNLGGTADEEFDATTLSIFPGAIDAHVHFNEPGRAEWESFNTGSRAAAIGGTTTVFDMPLNARPPTIDGPSFDAKRAAAESQSVVDFGFWGGLVPGNLGDLRTLRDRGVVGFKAFMCSSGIDDFPAVTVTTLREGMKRAADLGLVVALHAESEEITARLTRAKVAAGRSSVRDYLESRPPEAEMGAIVAAIELARETGCGLHIVHVSSGRAVGIIKEARKSGVDVTCETCPHYLFLVEEDLKKIGAPAKCAPPLRSAVDQRQLWHRLQDVTTIGSDHSPCLPAMKQRENFFEVWGGISGCQHLLPLLVDSPLPHNEIIRLTSEGVARRFGIAQKGSLAVGNDADLSIIDTAAEHVVTAESLHYRHKQSPYIGRHLSARVVRTILRGQTICQDGKLLARPIGKLVRPSR